MNNNKQPGQPVGKPIERPMQDRIMRPPQARRPARTSDIVMSPEAPGYEEWLRRNTRR